MFISTASRTKSLPCFPRRRCGCTSRCSSPV
nr:MAG TPA: hypothetical protein [Caudoviricetes sp.]DAV63142.1 MAG TPA: hypothetical protein [Caudoviricetes sp.]DAY81521.1 MAG TPA: hypothetical protein [Caudoviricetes sp.]